MSRPVSDALATLADDVLRFAPFVKLSRMQLPTRRASHRVHGCALLSYAVVALFFNWPLPLDLGARLTGPVGGDTGTYVWNIWVFRHELIAHGRFPLFTQEILSLTPPVALSLHNYTLFADLLAFPLIPLFGVIATFNVIYLALSILTAWSMFVLARSVVGRTGEAWLAGLLFGFSPILIARGTAHFSLAAAAPLPIFLLMLRRAERDQSPTSRRRRRSRGRVGVNLRSVLRRVLHRDRVELFHRPLRSRRLRALAAPSGCGIRESRRRPADRRDGRDREHHRIRRHGVPGSSAHRRDADVVHPCPRRCRSS